MAVISTVGRGVPRGGAPIWGVVLRIWGFTERDILLAEQSARRAVERVGWVVADCLRRLRRCARSRHATRSR
jgi:hypothetical protein